MYSLYIPGIPCIPGYSVYSLYSRYSCIPGYSVYSCIPVYSVYSRVFPCIQVYTLYSVYSRVFPCIPVPRAPREALEPRGPLLYSKTGPGRVLWQGTPLYTTPPPLGGWGGVHGVYHAT